MCGALDTDQLRVPGPGAVISPVCELVGHGQRHHRDDVVSVVALDRVNGKYCLVDLKMQNSMREPIKVSKK